MFLFSEEKSSEQPNTVESTNGPSDNTACQPLPGRTLGVAMLLPGSIMDHYGGDTEIVLSSPDENAPVPQSLPTPSAKMLSPIIRSYAEAKAGELYVLCVEVGRSAW